MKQIIRDTALRLARDIGVQNVTKSMLCRKTNVSEGSFNHIMGESFTELINSLQLNATRTITGKRVKPAFRKESILLAAVELAYNNEYSTMNRRSIAKAAQVSPALVTKYFPTLGNIRLAVMIHAINQGIPEIVVQGLAIGDALAKAAPQELKEAAIQLLHKE